MKDAGNVVHAELFTNREGVSRGYGYRTSALFRRWVEFSTEDEAAAAIKKLNASTLEGRTIGVKEYEGRPERTEKPERIERKRSRDADRGQDRERERDRPRGDPDVKRRQLYVGNLPFSMDWRQLKDVFGKYGEVERANLVTKKDVVSDLNSGVGHQQGLWLRPFHLSQGSQKGLRYAFIGFNQCNDRSAAGGRDRRKDDQAGLGRTGLHGAEVRMCGCLISPLIYITRIFFVYIKTIIVIPSQYRPHAPNILLHNIYLIIMCPPITIR